MSVQVMKKMIMQFENSPAMGQWNRERERERERDRQTDRQTERESVRYFMCSWKKESEVNRLSVFVLLMFLFLLRKESLKSECDSKEIESDDSGVWLYMCV